MMLVPTYLAPSAIEGLGVFTRRPLRAGEMVWRFDRRFDLVIAVADIAAADTHVREFMDRYTYPLPADPERFVVLDGDEGRFMNHADDPNCEFPPRGLEGWARRDIAADEELTCDYAGFTYGPMVFQPARHLLHRPATASVAA